MMTNFDDSLLPHRVSPHGLDLGFDANWPVDFLPNINLDRAS